jgi:hypothetical protein
MDNRGMDHEKAKSDGRVEDDPGSAPSKKRLPAGGPGEIMGKAERPGKCASRSEAGLKAPNASPSVAARPRAIAQRQHGIVPSWGHAGGRLS